MACLLEFWWGFASRFAARRLRDPLRLPLLAQDWAGAGARPDQLLCLPVWMCHRAASPHAVGRCQPCAGASDGGCGRPECLPALELSTAAA